MHMERRVLSSLDIRYRARKGAQEKQLWQELARGLEPLLGRCKCGHVEARTLQYHLQGVAARRIRFDDYNSLWSVAHRTTAFRPRQLRTARPCATRWGMHLTMTTFGHSEIHRNWPVRQGVAEKLILAPARRC